MTKVTEGLVLAMCALPKEDKSAAVSLLLEDGEIRAQISKVIVERLAGPRDIINAPPPRIARPNELSRRARGKRERDEYMSQLRDKGVVINSAGGIWAKASSDLWIAMPFAKEIEKLPDRWFLGLGEKDLLQKKQQGKVVIIMLCRSRTGIVMDFVIPPSKAEEFIPDLRTSKGQYKINLKKIGVRYHLLLTGLDPVDVTDYRSQISVLRD